MFEIQYSEKYEGYGHVFEGNLAIIDYSAQGRKIKGEQALDGFNRNSTLDALHMAEEYLKEKHPEGFEDLLGVPILVVRLNESKT